MCEHLYICSEITWKEWEKTKLHTNAVIVVKFFLLNSILLNNYAGYSQTNILQGSESILYLHIYKQTKNVT
jgi:hypothetical protein